MTDLHLTVTEAQGTRAVLAAAGEMTSDTASYLYDEGVQIIAVHPHLALDVAGVTFCDSSGLNALVRLRRHALGAGGSLVLANVPRAMERLLSLTGMLAVFAPDAPGPPGSRQGAE